jgi:hypothetical protein
MSLTNIKRNAHQQSKLTGDEGCGETEDYQ